MTDDFKAECGALEAPADIRSAHYAGISTTELARRIVRDPSSIGRRFTAQTVRPELPLIVYELGARVEITAARPAGPTHSKRVAT